MRAPACAVAVVTTFLIARASSADEGRDLTVSLESGGLIRSTTPRPYDSLVPTLGVRGLGLTRAHTRLGSYAHGPSLGFTYAAGPRLGFSSAEPHREFLIDTGYILSLPLFESLAEPIWVFVDVGLALEIFDTQTASAVERIAAQENTQTKAAMRRHLALGPRILGGAEWRFDVDLRSGRDDFIVATGAFGLRNVHTLGGHPESLDFAQFTLGAGVCFEL